MIKMAKTRERPQRMKPVLLYPENHLTLRKIAFMCDQKIEKMVNIILKKGLSNKELLKDVLLELEADPRCLDGLDL